MSEFASTSKIATTTLTIVPADLCHAILRADNFRTRTVDIFGSLLTFLIIIAFVITYLIADFQRIAVL